MLRFKKRQWGRVELFTYSCNGIFVFFKNTHWRPWRGHYFATPASHLHTFARFYCEERHGGRSAGAAGGQRGSHGRDPLWRLLWDSYLRVIEPSSEFAIREQ